GGGTGGLARIVSVSRAGALRWIGNDGAGNNLNLGAFDATSVIVGDGGQSGRCYVTSNAGGVGAIEAYRKDTGARLWSTPLPGSNFPGPGNALLTPALYNGKLYVIGARSGTSLNVYRVDSAGGTLEQTTSVSGFGVDCQHQMAFVPNAFGTGLHGIYFNGDSGNGSDGIPEMYGVRASDGMTPAALIWSSDGGKVARSHVVYSATTNRLYTHTWNDYGAEFYTWDPLAGAPVLNQNQANDGHGFYDVGCLDFSGTDVVTGAFTGHVIRYHDTGAGMTVDTLYQTLDWWGELRNVGGLYKDTAGHSVLVSGTNSRVVDFGPMFTARVFALDATTAIPFSPDDGPIYFDNLKMTGGPTTGLENTIVDTNGFTGYPLGSVIGLQNSSNGGTGNGTWALDNAPPSGVTDPGVANDPTGSGMGKVLSMNAAGSGGGWQGADLQLPSATTDNIVIVSWDQWRADTGDNVWLADHLDFAGWWTLEWDSAFPNIPRGGAYARQFNATPGPIQLTPGVWQHIEYRFDFGNGVVTVTIGANSATEFLDIFGSETSLRGIDLEIEGTGTTEQTGMSTPRIFEWDTGVGGAGIDHGFTIRGGPLLGPTPAGGTQQIYYFNGSTRNLVAIKPAAVPLTITAANPPAPSGNPYQPGLPYTDVLDTSAGAPTSALTAGIGASGTPSQGPISYAPIQVTFNSAVTFATADVSISCTRAPCPSVMGASSSGNTTTINLTAAIPPLGCTTLTFTGGQRIQYRSRPGDPNLDGSANTADLLAIVTAINNGTANMPGNLGRYNIDRTGGVNTQDLLREVQLLNGVNTTNVFATAGPADACPP
ncbi:MAG TPA: hypothetical protein VGM03_04885, partial [Phycisphaerae bacterium]